MWIKKGGAPIVQPHSAGSFCEGDMRPSHRSEAHHIIPEGYQLLLPRNYFERWPGSFRNAEWCRRQWRSICSWRSLQSW